MNWSMEWWSDGVLGELETQHSITPILHHSMVEMFAMATADNDAPLAAELKLIAGLTVKIAEPLARYTSMKVGGPADYFIEVENEAALANLLGVLSSAPGKFLPPRQRQQCLDQRPRRARRGDSSGR